MKPITPSLSMRFQSLSRCARACGLLLAACTLFATSVEAANQYFSTTGGSLWDATTTSDWGAVTTGPYNAKWTSGNVAIYEGTAGTVTVSGTDIPTCGGITFNVTGYTLSGGTIKVASGSTIRNTITTSGSIATINSVIADSTGSPSAVTYSGGNFNTTIALNGANTYSGASTIDRCVVNFNTLANGGSSSSFGQGGNTVPVTIGTVNSSTTAAYTGSGGSTDRPFLFGGDGLGGQGTINNNGSGAISFNNAGPAMTGNAGNRNIGFGGTYVTTANTFAGALADMTGYTTTLTVKGNWNLTGVNTYSGSTTISGTLTIGGAGQLGSGAYAQTIANSGALKYASSAAQTLSGVISGTGSLTDSGAGTLTLSGVNTYTGGTTVSEGTLNVNNDQSAANGGWTLNASTGTANFNAGSTVAVPSSKSITVGGSGSSGNTLSVAGTVNNAGSMTISRRGTLNLNSGANWLQSGAITIKPTELSGYSAILNINSGAMLTYTGSGEINVSPSLNAPNNNGSGVLTIAGGTLVTGQGFANTVATSTGTATINFTTGGTLKLSASIPNLFSTAGSANSVTLGTGGGVIDTAAFNTALGTVISGADNLTKAGTGTLTLSGANTYAGNTTISGGTLLVNGSLASGSAVAVNNTGTLGGTGTIGGSVTVSGGGTLAPGTSIGQLTLSSTLTLASGSTSAMEINNTGGTTSADQANVTGLVTFGGTLRVIYSGDTLAANDEFLLYPGSSRSGSFSGLSLVNWPNPNLRVSLATLNSDGKIRITANNAPTATGFALVTEKNTVKSVNLDKYASDPDGDFLGVSFSTPGHGTVALVNGKITYTPTAEYTGSDSFTYQVSDPSGGASTAVTVSVTVTANSGRGANIVGVAYDDPSDTAKVTAYGILGHWYHLQYTADPLPNTGSVTWTDVGSDVQTDATGQMVLTDTTATTGMRFYRTRYVGPTSP